MSNDSKVFCIKCGEKVPEQPSFDKFCSYCGKDISIDNISVDKTNEGSDSNGEKTLLKG